MLLKNLVALSATLLLCVSTGCHLTGGCGGAGCDSIGCDSYGGSCASGGCSSGSCGGLLGMLPGGAGGCGCGSITNDTSGCVTPAELGNDGYGTRGGMVGPLAGMFGQHHRGAQSHMGAYPGPADGPPSPTVTYPYYTTRAPRDYFAANPPSIGP
jgi:hypothetical protein